MSGHCNIFGFVLPDQLVAQRRCSTILDSWPSALQSAVILVRHVAQEEGKIWGRRRAQEVSLGTKYIWSFSQCVGHVVFASYEERIYFSQCIGGEDGILITLLLAGPWLSPPG